MRFSMKDFFSKCDQIRSFGHIYWKNPSWKTSFFVQYLLDQMHVHESSLKLVSEISPTFAATTIPNFYLRLVDCRNNSQL